MRQATILERASFAPNAEAAMSILRDALKLTSDNDVSAMIDGRGFRHGTDAHRLMLIADFLRAECFAAIERGQRLVQVSDPLHLVGTRD